MTKQTYIRIFLCYFDQKGIAMAEVPEQSVAWQKGFRSGDFITSVDGQGVEGIENFLRIVDGKYAPGSSSIHIYRNQGEKQLKINW